MERETTRRTGNMKIGDRVKGFRFGANDAGVVYVSNMDGYVGKSGRVRNIKDGDGSFQILFDDDDKIWTYPIAEYITIQREKKLSKLGI